HLLNVAATPSAALDASRAKYSNEVLTSLIHYRITDVIGIGGGDTADGLKELSAAACRQGYELVCIHASKTHDNDIPKNYACPGFPSAAQCVAEPSLDLYL